MNDQDQKSVAQEAIEKITSSDKSTKKDMLLAVVPEGYSPKAYITLSHQLMGIDKEGKLRPDEDLLLFLYTAKRTGLDPLTHQIYAVYRWDSRLGKDRMTIQTGIDGLRLVAQRSGNYAGQDDIIFEPKDESTKNPIRASVTVYKMINGLRVAFTATARWSAYVQLTKDGQPQGLWSKMPYLMLGKCAESLALRKAFPNELSGIYSEEEMSQSTNILADLPKPDKMNKAGGLANQIKVEHGAPVVSKGDMNIGSADTKKITEETKPEAKDKNTEVKPDTDVAKIRKQLEEMKKREHDKNNGLQN